MKCETCKKQITLKGDRIKIKELGIEVERELHTDMRNKDSIVIPKGMRLLTLSELLYLWNKRLVDFGKDTTGDLVYEIISNPSDENIKENPYWAVGFCHSFGRFHVDGDVSFGDVGRSRGVRFVRDLKVRKS